MTLVVSTSAETRLSRVRQFLAQSRAADVVVVGPNKDALADVVRAAAKEAGAVFGWQRVTFARFAGTLAAPALALAGLVPIGALGVEALCARLVHRLVPRRPAYGGSGDPKSRGELERLAPIADFPGLPKALSRTLEEVRLARVDPASLAPGDEAADVARLAGPFVELLAEAKLADRAAVLAAAIARAKDPRPHALLDRPVAFVDVRLDSELEAELLAAIAARAPSVLFTICAGDEATLARARAVGLGEAEPIVAGGAPGPIQEQLFSERADLRAADHALTMFSAPGESRECVEIARIAKNEAAAGTRFDRMAVLLRAPTRYRAHLEEALRRAQIPAHFARGTARPDPSGRALLALIACKLESLSATRFAEYLSLGELPPAEEEGAPPHAADPESRYVVPDSEVVGEAVARAGIDEDDEPSDVDAPENAPVALGSLRAPRHWERLLVDAAVIEGKDRWERRLDGLRHKFEDDLAQARRISEEDRARAIERDLEAIVALRDFALPLLGDLEALPASATWGEWIDALSALASRALRSPSRVLAALAELSPMAEVGPVDLREARLVLEQRLTDVIHPPSASRYGKIFVATPDEARGMEFDVVFAPGLAEKMFPQKVIEDPILPDAVRAGTPLTKNEDRSAAERLALRLAVGAASRRFVASYPRLDVEQARPRTPSFYALELIRAAEGVLPGFDDLARRSASASVRIGWPAPLHARDAIDEAEYDLAILERLLQRPAAETVGAARYLLGANPHLGRALRFRAERWNNLRWYRSDGLVHPSAESHQALRAHDLSARSFSPTALQNFAACPYRFLLQAVHRLAPREEPAPLEDIDPLQRGSMMHESMYETLVALRDQKLLPVTHANLPAARAVLERATTEVAARYADDLKPAIPRVWDDGIARIRADLAEWLRRLTTEDSEVGWTPTSFELSFGLKELRGQQDPLSTLEPIDLECGIKLRGSIDLVERRERDGWLRATDFKSGKVRADDETIIGGGKTLQPVLYALAIEKRFPGATIWGGRLYYCTSAGDYRSIPIPLGPEAREEAKLVADTIHDAIDRGFLPASPAKGECQWCDYQRVCGPYEEQRTKRKPEKDIVLLTELRKRA
ncbi:MAG TPA: PD-(D/E)XK nuclease family protein [Polyangiaceae bacterium]